MATDWAAIKLAYIHGTDTMRELASKNNIGASGLMRRAAKEGWDAARKQESAKVSAVAHIALGGERAAKLAKFNDDDAKIADSLKEKATAILNSGECDDRTLANITRVFETAQKIGLLALGAATDKQDLTSSDGSMSPKTPVYKIVSE